MVNIYNKNFVIKVTKSLCIDSFEEELNHSRCRLFLVAIVCLRVSLQEILVHQPVPQ